MADDKIRLALEILGEEGVKDLRAALAATNSEAAELTAALGRGEISIEEYDAEMRRVAATARNLEQALKQLDAAQAAVADEAARAAAALDAENRAGYEAAGSMGAAADKTALAAKGIKDVGAAAGAAKSGFGGLQSSIIAGSYAFQDFTATSGDLGAKLNSVTNNIPTLLAGLGGIGIALGIAATAGVAVYRNWDSIASLWEDRNPFPKAANDIEGLKRELDRAKDGLEKFEKAGTGTVESIAKYNELRTETARLEKEIADQQERQALLKKAIEAPTEAQEGRAKGFQEAVKGRGQETLDTIRTALEKQGQMEIEAAAVQRTLRQQAFDREEHTAEERLAFANEQAAIFRSIERGVRGEDLDAKAKDLFAGLLKGEERAGVLLGRLVDGTGVMFGDLQARAEAADPVLKKKADEFADALTKQGEEGEKAALAEVAAIKTASDAKVKVVLDTLKQQGGIEALAADLAAEAKKQGLDVVATFEFVKQGLQDTILAHLGDLKIKPGAGGAAQVEAVALAAAGGARKEAVKEEGKEAKGEAKEVTDEAKKITDILGKQRQAEYEALVAGSAAARAGAGPVARTAKQEAAFKRAGGVAGVDYGLPAGVLEQRLRGNMAREFQARGASPQAAAKAAEGIADKGNQDLQRRAATFAGQGLSALEQQQAVTRDLVAAYQGMSGMLRQLEANARGQQRQIRATRVSSQKTVH